MNAKGAYMSQSMYCDAGNIAELERAGTVYIRKSA